MALEPCAGSGLVMENGDIDDNGEIDLSDGQLLLEWLYRGGLAPVDPCEIGSGGWAIPREYSFQVLARLGDPLPGGGSMVFDFEPSGINDGGDVAFGCDFDTGGEGILLRTHDGQLSVLARPGDPAPGGGTFDGFFFVRIPINDVGDVAFHFFLDPFQLPSGLNSAIYRYSHVTRAVSAVFVPGVTPAPGGGTFAGATISTSMNNSGDIAFTGIVTGADIDPDNPPGFDGLGNKVFMQSRDGTLVKVVAPGDSTNSGRIFDIVTNPWIGNNGDVAFDGHLVGDTCIDFGVPQSDRVFCAVGTYIKKASSGTIVPVAEQGQAAPGGGNFAIAFGPVMNSAGQVVFIGDLTPEPAGGNDDLGVFLYSNGKLVSVARPGDAIPGGGTFARSAFYVNTYHLNNRGEVTFNGFLDDGTSGLFIWRLGQLGVVVRAGTVIPGAGTVVDMSAPGLIGSGYAPGAWSNDHGQILFTAAVDDGSGDLTAVLVIATPRK